MAPEVSEEATNNDALNSKSESAREQQQGPSLHRWSFFFLFSPLKMHPFWRQPFSFAICFLENAGHGLSSNI
jgi:hypothetical protein